MFDIWEERFAKVYLRQLLMIILAVLISSVMAQGQMAPPAQDHVLRFTGYEITRAPLVSELNLGNTFTMEAWVYLEAYQPYAVLMGKPHDTRHSDPWMSYVLEIGSTNCFEFAQSTGQAGTYRTASAPTAAILKKWTHLAAILSSGTMRLYVDGQEVAFNASPGIPNNTTIPFALGAGADAGGSISAGGSNGALRQARVWNYALSSSEIEIGRAHV